MLKTSTEEVVQEDVLFTKIWNWSLVNCVAYLAMAKTSTEEAVQDGVFIHKNVKANLVNHKALCNAAVDHRK